MGLYPVIMCGGGGTRLWPASRPSRPKQFIALAGNRSLFQETVERVAPLATGQGRTIVVAGKAHRDTVLEQLDEIGAEAILLLEPEPRDSAPAMAAAMTWALRQDPDAILAFIASDHHVPDHEAFRTAVLTAAQAAQRGRIVTLGVRPDTPSSAYGYIKPAGEGLAPVAAFVEKPDTASAAAYIEAGYLWNSGNFIVRAGALRDELTRHAPAVLAFVDEALPDSVGISEQLLGDAFGSAPRISIDYAVMEKTSLASVLPVDFVWSDLGAWDAIAATGEGDFGSHLLEDADGCLVRAPEGVLVGALGVRNLAIVAESDAVLVADLSRAQDVKRLVERMRTVSPQHLDFTGASPEPLPAAAERFADWLRLRALPTWACLGVSEQGAFSEGLTLDGRSWSASRRARVQARQIYVYAQAGRLGWDGPWARTATRGLEWLVSRFLRPDGLCRTLLSPEGEPQDEAAWIYDQAFVLLALATVRQAGVAGDHEALAVKIRENLEGLERPEGGFVEQGPHPFQANAHMHLLEACLAWEQAGGDAGWSALADRIVRLATAAFIDEDLGCLREFFDSRWQPASGQDGRLVEPGHQFEWAWLLVRHGRARGRADLTALAHRLYDFGRRGVGARPVIAFDALDTSGQVTNRRSRLWPQTEWLKASLALADQARDGEREAHLEDAAAALRALWSYLTPDGLWRDKHLGGGRFIDEPAPASSFYHIMAAFNQLSESASEGRLAGLPELTLS